MKKYLVAVGSLCAAVGSLRAAVGSLSGCQLEIPNRIPSWKDPLSERDEISR